MLIEKGEAKKKGNRIVKKRKENKANKSLFNEE